MIRAFLLLPLLVLGSAGCDAQAPSGAVRAQPPIVQVSPAASLPAPTGRVVDRADVLPDEAEGKLTARLESLEEATTDQLVVVTVDSLHGEEIRDFGLRVGKSWGVGRKGVDNGVLLIVAPTERKARIEVGYGLEGLLTDERAQKIIDEQVVPACREGRCDRAIMEGVDAIARLLRSDPKRPQRKPGAA